MQHESKTKSVGSGQPLAHFLKTASYTGNYHQKYFYPKQVHTRIAARLSKDDTSCSREQHVALGKKNNISGQLDNSLVNANKDGQVHGQESGDDLWSFPSTTRVCGGILRSACSWFLSKPTSGSVSPGELAPNQSNIEYSGLPAGRISHTMDSPTANIDSIHNGNHTASEQEANWDRVALSAVAHATESVTSEDSVFSDDYTAMTELGEVVDVRSMPDHDIGRRRSPPGGSEDADSSFSSPGSSASTLEADGKEDGGDVEVVCKDKVTDSVVDFNLPAHGKHKQRPNIKLWLGQPVIEIGGDPSSAVMDGEADTADNDNKDKEQALSEPGMSHLKNSDSSSFYEDREFDFLKTEPVRRSTSLKTYKTPPGTPSRKKGVRFADALGLDLESVRHILNLEEPPVVPKSAMKDLIIGLEEDHKANGVKYLSALFSQPGADPGFQSRVREGKVVLENCVIKDTDMAISGTIRVANIAFHKSVIVRYSTNGWVSSDDIVASYVQNSTDGPTDRFSFILHVPKYFSVGQRLQFAIMYHAEGHEFWDNNFGDNYVVECYAKAMPVSESDNTWMHFL